ncbi:MAG: hypothetical protein H7210_07015 [Pyrinomonadaceae bacterium]|nr:hypothetical protein [Phycisphaerales bacterium]
MGTLKFRDSADLYHYLIELASKFETSGRTVAAAKLKRTSLFVHGTPQTDFLGESLLVLRSLSGQSKDVLSERETRKMLAVIEQLEEAFRNPSGA